MEGLLIGGLRDLTIMGMNKDGVDDDVSCVLKGRGVHGTSLLIFLYFWWCKFYIYVIVCMSILYPIFFYGYYDTCFLMMHFFSFPYSFWDYFYEAYRCGTLVKDGPNDKSYVIMLLVSSIELITWTI